jgi:hypothetical protein
MKNLQGNQEIRKWLGEKTVSELTEIPLSTLRNQRHRGVGIPYIKRGRMVRYELAAVIAYMEGGRIETDSI